MEPESDSQELTAFGLAALLPGMRRARKELDDRIRNYEQRLIDLQHASSNGHIRKGRPPKILNLAVDPDPKYKQIAAALKTAVVKPGGESWAGLTRKQRSAEMKRRMAKARANKRSHQNVAAGKMMKGFWAKMTPQERSAEMKRRRRVAEAKKIAEAAAQ